MKTSLEMERKKKSDEIIAHAVRHLPIVKEFAMKLGIVEIVNELAPSQMDEDPGTIFLAMILDTLSGRTPLYRLDEFFETQDTELLLGKKPKAEAFEDYNVARVLDKACSTGTMKIFTEIAEKTHVCIADSAMVTKRNLERIGDSIFLRVAFRRPATNAGE